MYSVVSLCSEIVRAALHAAPSCRILVAKNDPEVRAWLHQREQKHIPLMTALFNKQREKERLAIIEISKGSWLLDIPEIQGLKDGCHENAFQLTDLCEFGLKDPENKLPHRRSVALLANFPLHRSVRLCGGHQGKAHQWTKGNLSQRYGGVSRLGYSQRWTPQFSRDTLDDFADYLNPLKAKSPGTHQSQSGSRSTFGCQRKIC